MSRFYIRDKIDGKWGIVDMQDSTCEYLSDSEMANVLEQLKDEFCDKSLATGSKILRNIYKGIARRDFDYDFFSHHSIPDLDAKLSKQTLLGRVSKVFDYSEAFEFVIIVVKLNINDLLILKTNGYNFEYLVVEDCIIPNGYPCMGGFTYNRIVFNRNVLPTDNIYIKLARGNDIMFVDTHLMTLININF